MESNTLRSVLAKILVFLAISATLLVVSVPVGAFPPRPPRVFPAPTTVPTPEVNTSFSTVDGGFIRLRLSTANPTLSAVVQWQDANGNWHSVSGWRSELSEELVKWEVNPNDFGKGPFRWMIYERSQNNVIAVSDNFFLPASYQQVVDIYMSLE